MSSSVVFVFFDPWTVVGGKSLGMVNSMLASGFQLLDFEFRSLRESDAEEIYRPNHPIRIGSQWHVARRVYDMGRSLGVLMAHRDAGACACTLMRQLKGRACPPLNAPGTLRYDFGAPNRSLSLMHSSDDEGHLEREAPVFFPAARLEVARRRSRNGEASACSAAAVGQLEESAIIEAGAERFQDPGLLALLARLRLRVARLLEPAAQGAGAGVLLEAYRWHWQQEASSTGASLSVPDQARRYLGLVRGEGALLDPLLAALQAVPYGPAGPANWYRPDPLQVGAAPALLRALANPSGYSRWNASRTLWPGLLADRWEEILLDTTLIHFDDFLSEQVHASPPNSKEAVH